MIDTEALRKKVIDLAIQGKLTEQLSSDGDAETLYAKIQEEKARLVKEGKIKKDKALPEITEDEIPFEIPGSWKWCRLGEIYCVLMGQSPDGMNVGTDIDGMEFHQGKIYFGEKFLMKSEQKSSELTRVADEKSVLLCVRAPVGVVNITERKICIGRGLCALKALSDMEPYFLFYYLLSCRKSFENSGTGSTFSSITVDVVKKHLIPIPPLSEQRRIVEVLDNVFNQFEVIDDLQSKYSNDLTVLKSKIIDAGIQGKLTEQLPEDGTAEKLYQKIQEEKAELIKNGKIKKEKALPDITEEEIPFEIPDNWKWVRISDVIDVRDGTHDSPKYHNEGIPLVTSKNISSGALSFDDVKFISSDDANKINERSHVDDGDILFAMIGSIGNPVIIHKDREFCIKNVALFKNFVPMYISMEYFYWFLMHEQFVLRKNAIGGLQPFVSLKAFRNHLMPLPPINEQIRIAGRLYELKDTE